MQLTPDKAGNRIYTVVPMPLSEVLRMRGVMPEVWEQGLKNNLSSTFLSPRLQGGSSTARFWDFIDNSFFFKVTTLGVINSIEGIDLSILFNNS